MDEEKIRKLEKKWGLGRLVLFNLNHIKRDVLYKDYDALFLVCGYEGYGKSTFAMRCCLFLFPQFSNKYIPFVREDWDKIKMKLQKGDSIDFTEGTEMAMSKEAMKVEVREFERELTQWRGKNLFFFIEISDIKMISRYIRESRAVGLFYIPKRGIVWYFHLQAKNPRGASKVIELRKELMKGNFVKPTFISWFKPFSNKDEVWEEYARRKKAHIRREKESKEARRLRLRVEKMLEGSLTLRELAKGYKVHPQTIRDWIKKHLLIYKKYRKCVFKDFSRRVRLSKEGIKALDKKVRRNRAV